MACRSSWRTGIGHGAIAHASQYYARAALHGIAHKINRHASATVNHIHSRQILAARKLGKGSGQSGIFLPAVIKLGFAVDNPAKAARFKGAEGLHIKRGDFYSRAGREHPGCS